MAERDEEPAGEVRAVELIPQPHGGALARGGFPGNRGGRRPKEELRERMRENLGAALEAMRAQLAGERLAHDAAASMLSDPRLLALTPDVRAIVAAIAADHLTATLRPRELGQFTDTLARYGVGTLHEEEHTETHRYVVQLPARVPLAVMLERGETTARAIADPLAGIRTNPAEASRTD